MDVRDFITSSYVGQFSLDPTLCRFFRYIPRLRTSNISINRTALQSAKCTALLILTERDLSLFYLLVGRSRGLTSTTNKRYTLLGVHKVAYDP